MEVELFQDIVVQVGLSVVLVDAMEHVACGLHR
jgi:hypothetical protein